MDINKAGGAWIEFTAKMLRSFTGCVDINRGYKSNKGTTFTWSSNVALLEGRVVIKGINQHLTGTGLFGICRAL